MDRRGRVLFGGVVEYGRVDPDKDEIRVCRRSGGSIEALLAARAERR